MTKRTPVSSTPLAGRKAWVAPRVETLPRLTELTLATGAAIPGSGTIGGGSGGTVF
jgi:hypothetical protein